MKKDQPTSVAILGQGRIGAPVAEWISASEHYRLSGFVDRLGNLPDDTGLIIDCAGPAALSQHGERLLARAPLWSVGAVALMDTDFQASMKEIARTSGHRLRLFTAWIGGTRLVPGDMTARLHIEQAAPGLADRPGMMFEGPLREAVNRFPDQLNTACAAALVAGCVNRTTLVLTSSPAGGPHFIRAALELPGSSIRNEVDLSLAGSARHPVSSAIIAALGNHADWFDY